jgi:hypothetical protein
MYLNAQILPLLAVIEEIANSESNDGCSDDLTVASKSAIDKAVELAKQLKTGARELVIGLHDHRHGISRYGFAVAPGSSFDDAAFQQYLGDTFEPDEDEKADLVIVPDAEIAVIDPLPGAANG